MGYPASHPMSQLAYFGGVSMNKKKIMILFLALMTLSITACGQDATADDESIRIR